MPLKYMEKAKAGNRIIKGWTKNKKDFQSKEKISWSIYPGKIKGKQRKAWVKLHKFKYFFIIPLLGLAKRYVRPVEIRDEPQNRNFILFNEIFERSITDWTMFYLRGNEIHAGQLEVNKLNKQLNGQSQTILRDMKLLMFQFIEKDTAYREFFNILFYNMVLYGNAVYNGEKIEHLIYNRDGDMDLEYKSWWDKQPSLLHKVRKKWLR